MIKLNYRYGVAEAIFVEKHNGLGFKKEKIITMICL